MSTEEVARIACLLRQSLTAERVAFAHRLTCQFALAGRVIARCEDAEIHQRRQLQGCLELLVRMLDQERDFSLGPGHGRPEDTFLEMLFEYGEAYDLTEEITESVVYAVKDLKPAGRIN